MHYVKLDKVRVPDDRMRKEFDEDAHDELCMSIMKHGLLHPITLAPQPDGTFALVAGERRLRAMRDLISAEQEFLCGGDPVPVDMVPYLHTHETESIALLEVELEENVKRKDLTAIEQVQARKKLFDLRKMQAMEQGKTYTQKDFAEELARSGATRTHVVTVGQELVIAQHLDNPEVRNAKTLKEAAAAVKKVTERILVDSLADLLEAEGVETRHKLLVGNSCELLKTLPAGLYDCVLTDPPYGIDIDQSGSLVEHTHHYNDSAESLKLILNTVPQELFRITRTQAHLYWFCDLRWLITIQNALTRAGWRVWDYPIVWWKRGKAMAPDVTKYPKRTYELIIYAIKGDRPTLKVAGDVIETTYGADLQQAEKPKELYVELLSRSVLPGCEVIDPFCGSGVIFSAASEVKCLATGVELDETRAKLARIKAAE
jgi:DNA modification methylase